MKKRKIIIIAVLLGFVCWLPGYENSLEMIERFTPAMTMVIDPGHGGCDSGAVAQDGTKEKDINLAISRFLKREGEKYNINVVMTRNDEDGLYENGNENGNNNDNGNDNENDNGNENEKGRWTKLGDMRQRRNIMDKAKADLVVSIHLNSFFSDQQVHGAQVFYPTNCKGERTESNEKLAEAVQKNLTYGIEGSAERILLPKKDMFIFQGGDFDGLLVECGFLSNKNDLEALKSPVFQKKISRCIMAGIAEYYDFTKRTKEH